MKVYVVMGNDYPDRVFAREADAKAFCDTQRSAADKKEDRHSAPRIHWRYYEFPLIQMADAL